VNFSSFLIRVLSRLRTQERQFLRCSHYAFRESQRTHHWVPYDERTIAPESHQEMVFHISEGHYFTPGDEERWMKGAENREYIYRESAVTEPEGHTVSVPRSLSNEEAAKSEGAQRGDIARCPVLPGKPHPSPDARYDCAHHDPDRRSDEETSDGGRVLQHAVSISRSCRPGSPVGMFLNIRRSRSTVRHYETGSVQS
jgi:hypothetical protein